MTLGYGRSPNYGSPVGSLVGSAHGPGHANMFITPGRNWLSDGYVDGRHQIFTVVGWFADDREYGREYVIQSETPLGWLHWPGEWCLDMRPGRVLCPRRLGAFFSPIAALPVGLQQQVLAVLRVSGPADIAGWNALKNVIAAAVYVAADADAGGPAGT